MEWFDWDTIILLLVQYAIDYVIIETNTDNYVSGLNFQFKRFYVKPFKVKVHSTKISIRHKSLFLLLDHCDGKEN